MPNPLSYSKFNTFSRCKRQFYYDYIAANHKAKHPIRKEAHYLKQLTKKTFWPGKIVEAALEDIVIAQRPILQDTYDKLIDYAERLINKQYLYSLSNDFRTAVKSRMEDKRLYFRLFGHEYGYVANGIKEDVLKTASQCFYNYQHIEIVDFNKSLHDILIHTNRYRLQQNIPFTFMGRNLICIPDYLIVEHSKIIIIDWKVSKSANSDFSKQLLMYLFAIYNTSWGNNKSLENIVAFEVNLYSGKVKRYKLNQDTMLIMEDYIFDFMRSIDGFIQNRKFDAIDKVDFPCTENLNSCNYCNFQKLCLLQEVNVDT